MKYPHLMLLKFMEQIPNEKDESICLYHLQQMDGFEIVRQDDEEILVKITTDTYTIHFEPIVEGSLSDKDVIFIEKDGLYHEFRRWMFGPGAHYEGTTTTLPYWNHDAYWET